MSDTITWLNHAGFLLSSGETRFVVDPWLEGSAFNHGWELLSPSTISQNQIDSTTHIWLSHEHPDHFSPGSLKRISPDVRSRIKVLYQPTLDRRVVSLAQTLGFATQTLPKNRMVTLSPGFRVMLGTVMNDSWLFTQTPTTTYLNVNDCGLSERLLQSFKTRLPSIDVLFIQFSYASWVGNEGEAERAGLEARKKLDVLLRAVDVLQPKYVVPFASFVYFSHPENFYLNEYGNRIDQVVRQIEARGVNAIVLYPGDNWSVGQNHDSATAVARYVADLSKITPSSRTQSVPLEELFELGRHCSSSIRERNGSITLSLLRAQGFITDVRIELTDLGCNVLFSPLQGLTLSSSNTVDVSMCSDSLAFCMRHGYGSDTLLVNGRFQERSVAGRVRLNRAFAIFRYNQHGYFLPSMLWQPSLLKARL